jgi:hypothetical protein
METTRQPQEVDRMLKSGKEVGIAGKFVCNTPPRNTLFTVFALQFRRYPGGIIVGRSGKHEANDIRLAGYCPSSRIPE